MSPRKNIDKNRREQNDGDDDDDDISTSPLGLGILYKTILAENCQNLKMAAIGQNM